MALGKCVGPIRGPEFKSRPALDSIDHGASLRKLCPGCEKPENQKL
jgi:hypothetical protein